MSALADYWEIDPHICFTQLTNIKQVKNEEIRSYIDRLVELAEMAHVEADRGLAA